MRTNVNSRVSMKMKGSRSGRFIIPHIPLSRSGADSSRIGCCYHCLVVLREAQFPNNLWNVADPACPCRDSHWAFEHTAFLNPFSFAWTYWHHNGSDNVY